MRRRAPSRGARASRVSWSSSRPHPSCPPREQIPKRTYERAPRLDLDGVEAELEEELPSRLAQLLHLFRVVCTYSSIGGVDHHHLAALEVFERGDADVGQLVIALVGEHDGDDVVFRARERERAL